MLNKLPLSQLLGSIGIGLLLLSGILQGKEQLLEKSGARVSQPQTLTVEDSSTQPQRDPSKQPVHIAIPGYIDSDITSEFYQDGIWSVSATSASHLQTSAYPGEPNNIIVYGHNKNSIFGPLRWLTGKEEITISLADGSKKNYVITEMTQVSPNQVQFLYPTDTEVLTMYTCAGLFDSERFIVRALPAEVLAATSSALAADAGTALNVRQLTTSTAAFSPNSYPLLSIPYLDLTSWNYYNWRTSYGQNTNL